MTDAKTDWQSSGTLNRAGTAVQQIHMERTHQFGFAPALSCAFTCGGGGGGGGGGGVLQSFHHRG